MERPFASLPLDEVEGRKSQIKRESTQRCGLHVDMGCRGYSVLEDACGPTEE